MRCLSDILLAVRSRCIIPSPIGIGLIGVWEHIIVLGWPLHVIAGDCIYILARGRVEQVELIAIVLVHVVDHIVHALVGFLGVNVGEIIPKENEAFVCDVVRAMNVKIIGGVLSCGFGVERIILWGRGSLIVYPLRVWFMGFNPVARKI